MSFGFGFGTRHRRHSMRGSPTLAQRLVALNANTFYVAAPYTTGAIAHRFTRNSGGASGSDLGATWPEWRHTGTIRLASTASDPTSPIGTWSLDSGAQDFALLDPLTAKFGGSYHGLGSGGTVQTVKGDGVTVDPLVNQAAASFRIDRVTTINWGTTTAVVTYSVTVGTNGDLIENISVNSATNFAEAYIGMAIGSGNYVEAIAGVPGTRYAMPATADQVIVNGATSITLRNPTDGRTVTSVSSAPGATAFQRSEIRPLAGTRNKIYFRFNGVQSTTPVTRVTTFGETAAGATSYNANLLTNGPFTSDLAGWTQSSGTTTWVAGTAQQVGSGTPNKLLQAFTATVGARYLVSAKGDNVSANANILLGIAANGSATGALVNRSLIYTGNTAVVFDATQTTHYAIPYQLAGAGTINWDDWSVTLLNATT